MSQDSLKKPILQNKEFFSDLIEKQRAEIEDLNFQKQVLVLDLDDAYKLQSNVLEHNDKLDNENTELKKETQILNHKLEQYKIQKQEFVKALDKYHEKQDELKGKIKGLKLENEIKERRSANLNSEINDLKEQNQIFKEENQILKSKLYQNESKIEKQINDLKTEIQKYKDYVAELEADIAEKSSSLKSKTEILKNTESMNYVLLRQQRQYQNQIKELKIQDDLDVENKSLKGSLHMVYEDNANLQSEVNDLKKTNQSLKNQNEYQNEREFELSNQIKDLKLESQEQIKTQKDLESQNKNLKESLQIVQEENFHLQSTLNYVEVQEEFYRQQYKSYCEKQADLENQIQVLKDQNTTFKEKVAQLERKNCQQIQGKHNKKDPMGNTDLHYIAMNGQSQLTNQQKVILKFASDINIKNKKGYTPLHFAVQYDKFEMVKVLLENGAKINTQNNDKMTPLHIAAWEGNVGMTKLLLKNGARKDVLNEKCFTPLELARICHNENIMALLK